MQLLFKFAQYFWTREKQEFNISAAVLVLVYRQALVWVRFTKYCKLCIFRKI